MSALFLIFMEVLEACRDSQRLPKLPKLTDLIQSAVGMVFGPTSIAAVLVATAFVMKEWIN